MAALAGGLRDRTRWLVASISDQLARARARHEKERDALRMLAPTARLAARRARFEAAIRQLSRLGPRMTADARAGLAAQAARLDSLSPLAVLSRGYALVRRQRDGGIVRRADEVAVGEALEVRLSEVDLDATVDAVRPRGSLRSEPG